MECAFLYQAFIGLDLELDAKVSDLLDPQYKPAKKDSLIMPFQLHSDTRYRETTHTYGK